MMTPAIKAEQLSVSYGGRRVLDQVSFAIPPGSFVAVLGGNGAGKTSLFRAIMGLSTPERGSVLVEGQPVGRGCMPCGVYAPDAPYGGRAD